MVILHTISSWNPAQGGPFFSVGNLTSALVRHGTAVDIIAGNYPHMPKEESPQGVRLHAIDGYLIPLIRQTLFHCPSKQIDTILDKIRPDVIHDNGMWLSLNHHISQAARRHSLPRIVSPRGTLDPWGIRYRNWKKKMALKLYQQKDLDQVTCFHAASHLEADNIREFGNKQPVVVIPNGVEFPAESAHFTDDTPRVALFIGRFHPVKNLPRLINAWAKVRPVGWHLKLVGPSEVGHREELRAQVQRLGVGNNVTISGPVYGEAKEALLRSAQLSFLISQSENFGIAAAEGLAVGIPVIASKATPWSCLEGHNLGWWIDPQTDELEQAIEAATSQSSAELAEIGTRGRTYAKEQFSWESIAGRFVATYSWLSGVSEKPEFVV